MSDESPFGRKPVHDRISLPRRASPVVSPALSSLSRAAGRGSAATSSGDASGRGKMSDPSRPPGLNRKQSHPQSAPRRPPVHQQLSAQRIYSSTRSPDNPPTFSSGPPLNTPASLPQYQSTSAHYDSRGNFVPQYTMPHHLGMAHTPPSFAYPHMYQMPVHPDMPQNIHQGFPPFMQPHAPVYPYHHSPEAVSPSAFSGGGPSSQYGFHQTHTPPSPHVPHPSRSSSSPFQSFSTPIPSPQYPYHPQQSFQASPPIYHGSQYPTSAYPQPYTSSPVQEGQGGWWYMPHVSALTPTQYDNPQPPYHYPTSYSQPDPSFAQSPSWQSYSHQRGPPTRNSPSPSLLPAAPLSSTRSAQGAPPASPTERPIVRRDYHPTLPTQRSEWVMWAGNVPPDATQGELWSFFNSIFKPDSDEGVVSVFLITLSNCAFVNFSSQDCLKRAVARFNGRSLRPWDPECPLLLCRIRKKDDDLIAGVGAQRGVGVHTRWVKAQKAKSRQSQRPSYLPEEKEPDSSSDEEEGPSSQVEGRRANTKGSSSGSYASSASNASTNSRFLSKYFPKRYFILKSLTQSDLDLSVEKGFWATQKHNESVLDQAYRTAKDVYLIFGVNKSGEFYGYARMSGPIQKGEHQVSWASRTDSPPSSRSSTSGPGGEIPEEQDRRFFPASEHRFAEKSPAAVTTPDLRKLKGKQVFSAGGPEDVNTPGPGGMLQSAPPEVGPPRSKLSMHSQAVKSNTYRDMAKQRGGTPFELDAAAPIRAIRSRTFDPLSTSRGETAKEDFGEEEEEEQEREVEQEGEGEGEERESWGEPFKVEWISTERLSFNRTQHIRNPWNHEREVKVSRDGTELEPIVGQTLLDEWQRLSEPPQVVQQTTFNRARWAGSWRMNPAIIMSPEFGWEFN